MATSFADVLRTFAYSSPASALELPPSITPNRTLVNERFIALHIILVRINPEAPTSEPAMIRMLLSIAKPVAAAANPEYEFSSAMTTGMSAPPMGFTRHKPNTDVRQTTMKKVWIASEPKPAHTRYATTPNEMVASKMLITCWPGKLIGFLNALIS